METISTDKIKEIKEAIKTVKASLKRIAENEAIQENARNNRDYDAAKNEVAGATLEMMQALEEAVRLTSSIGSTCDLYDIRECHKVVEYTL